MGTVKGKIVTYIVDEVRSTYVNVFVPDGETYSEEEIADIILDKIQSDSADGTFEIPYDYSDSEYRAEICETGTTQEFNTDEVSECHAIFKNDEFIEFDSYIDRDTDTFVE